MADTRPEGPESPSEQPTEVLSGREAIARVERIICRNAVTREPAVAEGLALAGVRAASLAEGPAAGSTGAVAVPGASCVHHVNGAPERQHAGAFELAARSVQEAVDHCLAAHLLSQKLGRVGLCSLAPALAERLEVVRLPGPAFAGALLGAEAEVAEPELEPERILDLAATALRAVGERTERAGDLVEYRGDDGAEVILVASGAEADAAWEAAQILSQAGVTAGALSVLLVRPFPVARVREALAGCRRVFTVGEPHRGAALLAQVRAAAGEASEVHLLRAGTPAQMLEGLVGYLPAGVFDPKRKVPEAAAPSRQLVLAPAGPWGEQTARQLGAALAQLGPLQLGPRMRHEAGATVLAWDGAGIPKAAGDLLLVAEPSLLDPGGPLSLIPPGSTALVVSSADGAEALAGALSPESRAAILERKLAVHWVPPAEADEGDPRAEADAQAASLYLVGASVAALLGPGKKRAAEATASLASRLEGEGPPQWLRAGAEAVRLLDPAALDPARHVQELDFRPTPALPRMPAAEDDEAQRARWAKRIWRFHVTGSAPGPAPRLPLRPAVLQSLAQSLRGNPPHPFVLLGTADAEQPVVARRLRELLGEGIEALQDAGRAARTLTDNLDRLATLAARQLAAGDPEVDLASLLSGAGQRLADELALPDQEERTLADDLAELCRVLPGDGVVLDLRPEAPLRLYLKVLEAVRAPQQHRFGQELEGLSERLRDLLQLDRMASREGRAPEALSASLGSVATNYMDLTTLSQTLPEGEGFAVLGDQRRERIERALATLEAHLEQREQLPQVILLRPPSEELDVTGAEQHEHPDPLAAAVGLFDGVARRMAEVFRAARTARMEAAGRYRPEVHDAALADLDWEAFTGEELDLVPAVVVVTSGRRLRQRDQSSLSELLRSSRPVQVVLRDEVGAADEAEDLSRFHVDLGYLVVAHREAFAVGSTLARPERLVEGFTRMARARRPAVALVQLSTLEPAPLGPLLAEAALQGRACCDFRYQPDAGASWADRFDLGGNPEPENAWPIHRVAYLEGGEERTLEAAFTFADAMALEPAYIQHLMVVAPVAWDESQLPLAEYVDRFDPELAQRSVPFLWSIDAEGTLQRAVVTRELALASRDRLRAWRVLQELAGYQNVFAERAAAGAREQALAEAGEQAAELERTHADQLEQVRSEAARESMERLAAVLINPDGLPALGAVAPPPAAAPPPPAETLEEAAAPAAPAEEVEEEAISFDEPYIDTALCTSCNECTNINGQLFQYNADKQAYIRDPAVGSFAELVKAAELCPARCIHPAKPRSGDSTATPELIERAAKFN